MNVPLCMFTSHGCWMGVAPAASLVSTALDGLLSTFGTREGKAEFKWGHAVNKILLTNSNSFGFI